MAGLGRKWTHVLFAVYLVILFRITVFRSTFGLGHLFQNGRIILSFFRDYIELIRQGNWFSFVYLFAGNIIWFVPFGMYMQYNGKCRNLLWAAVYGFLLSFLIETMQFVFGTGYSEPDDLILNTLGAWLGAFMVKAGKKSWKLLNMEWKNGERSGKKMKEILMMMLADCPYCKQADHMIQELQEENEKYRKLVIRRVDEEVDTKLAASLDYYYVPSFFVDGEKLMEGVPAKEKVQAVLDAALES